MKRKLSPSPVPAASSSMSSRETRGTASKSTIAAASTTSNVPADKGSPSIRRSNRVKQQDYSFGTDEWPLQGSSSSKTTNGVARKTRSFDEPVPTVLAVSTINCSRSNGGLTLNVPDACSRHQSQTNGHVGVQEEDDDYKPEDDSKDMKQSFFGNHVRFSPTTKSSSPTRRMDETRSRRQAANIARVRLQNLPSEDEQSEFNRRYSRDLRKRRRIQQEQLDFLPEPDTPNGSPILRVTRGMTGSVGKKSVRQVIDHDMADEESMSDQERPVHASRPGRRVAQQTRYFDDSYSMLDEDDQKIIVASTKVSGVTASTTTRTVRKVSHGNDDAKSDADEDRDVENDAEDEDEKAEEVGHPQSIRRSSRISTQRRLNVKESSEEDSGEKELRSRPKRNRVPVERLSYNTAKVRSSSRRASYRSDIRNLDQYSSDDEFQAADCRVRRRKYDTRESRSLRSTLKIRPPAANSRDTSSSSSSDGVANVDEQRFVQRKKKRMMIERAKMRPLNMSKDDMLMSVIRDRQKVGSSMADVSPMEVDTLVTFDSVGGSAEHINSLKEMVVLPLLYPELFSKFSITPPRGVLFHGPPGTGKTLLARALVNECSHDGRKVAFFMRKGADCLSKWIGESERQLRLLFDQAYLMRPSVIFFDEIDGLAPVRSSRNDQIHSSIVSTLLALLDGLDSRGEIVVIGATNRIENIDPALRRPGRFDRELRFTLPTRDARKEILTLHTKSWSPPVSDAMLNDLAESTIGYCGADLKGLCAEAALVALKRSYPQVYFTNQKLALDIEQVIVCQEDFVQAMKSMVPSTHRIYDQAQAPLPKTIRPLLSRQVTRLCEKLEKTLPIQSSTASGNPLLSTTSVLGSYRPRLLIFGQSGQGLTTYVGPAVLHYLEKLPCHKLDIPTLFSNSARCPEESLLYTIQEARRTAPSVLYIPHLIRFWHNVMTESLKHTFLSLISDIQPTAPLLILAIAEIDQAHPDTASDPTDCSTNIIHQLFQPEEVFVISDVDREERAAFFQPLFDVASAPVEESMSEKASKPLGPLQVLPVADSRELTSKEEQRLRRKEESLLRELRIFLRDIWNKINREQKFFMFRQPVDTEEVDDYLDIVKQPMDFDQMLCKLDDGQYNCAQDFLNDINLIAQNAILYNSDHHYETNRVICHRAKALQDFAYALVKAEMDTDFEDECKEISARRKKLTSVLNQEPSVNTAPASGSVTTTPTSATPGVACPTDLKSDGTLGSGGAASSDTLKGARRHKRRSLWSKGYVGSSRARKKPDTESLSPVIVNDTMNGCSSDEGSHYNDGASDVESPEKSTMPPRQPLILDDSGMEKFRAELLERTAHCHVEVLEKLFTRMMTCFQTGFKNKTDRTSLPTHLQGIMSSVLEPASRGFLEIANSKL